MPGILSGRDKCSSSFASCAFRFSLFVFRFSLFVFRFSFFVLRFSPFLIPDLFPIVRTPCILLIMNIRKARNSDFEDILTIISQCAAQLRSNGIEQWDDEYPTREMIAGNIATGLVYVGTSPVPGSETRSEPGQEAVIATLTIGAEKNDEYHRHIHWKLDDGQNLFFNQLAVLPAYQGNGLASQFMDFAEHLAERQEVRSLRLDAHEKSLALRDWYRKRGYQVRGTVPYRNGTCIYIAMEKTIPPTRIMVLRPPYSRFKPEGALLKELLAVRRIVFVEGQGVDPAIEQDGMDSDVDHLAAIRGWGDGDGDGDGDGGKFAEGPAQIVGCLRFNQLSSDTVKLERIAVLPQFRGLGIGKLLINGAVSEAQKRGIRNITMHAQFYLLDYYRGLGFEPDGELFFEADIKHITMNYQVQTR